MEKKADGYHERIFAYINGVLTSDERVKIENHLNKGCKDCAEELKNSKNFLNMLSKVKFQPIMTPHCFDMDILAQYAFKELSNEEMDRVAKHIHTCDYCLSEVLDLRAAEQSMYENLESESLSNIIHISEIYDSVKKVMPEHSRLKIKIAAQDEQIKEYEDIGNVYKIKTFPVDNTILLMKSDTCPHELNHLRMVIDTHQFFYEVFAVYTNMKNKILSGCDEYLPIEIKLPADTNVLMVLISQNSESFAGDKVKNIIDIIDGKTEGVIDEDIVCILIEIER